MLGPAFPKRRCAHWSLLRIALTWKIRSGPRDIRELGWLLQCSGEHLLDLHLDLDIDISDLDEIGESSACHIQPTLILERIDRRCRAVHIAPLSHISCISRSRRRPFLAVPGRIAVADHISIFQFPYNCTQRSRALESRRKRTRLGCFPASVHQM